MKHFFLLFVFLISSFAYGQKDTMKTTLPEVVISATKIPTSSIQLASSFTLITAGEIQEKQKTNVIDLLREVPGLSVTQSGGMGTMSNVYLRGANTYHTLVILDGVVLNDPASVSGAFDFSSLSSDNIERIEIVRGPQSTLYGSDAVAGIINIYSKIPTQKFSMNLNTEAGSNNYYKGSLSASGSFNSLNYILNYTQLKTGGISAADSRYGNTEPDGFQNKIFSANLGFNILPTLFANVIYRYTFSKGDLDQNEMHGDDPNFRTDFEENLFRVSVNTKLINDMWESTVGFSNIKKISHTIDDTDAAHPFTASNSFTNSIRTKLDWQNNFLFLQNHKITLGFETGKETASSTYTSESIWGAYDSNEPEESMRTTGMYLQDQISYWGSLFGTAGIRYDNNEKFGGQFTFRIAPAYLIQQTNTKIKATYGTGFKAPSLYYLFDPNYGNPDLRPETSTGWDAGIEQFFLDYKLSFGITYYEINFNNMFGMDKNYKEINIAKAATNGIELYAAYNTQEFFSAKMNYTYTYAVDKSPGSSEEGMLLIRRPMHKASIELNYLFPFGLNVNSSIVYVGKREDKDFSTYPVSRVTLPDYTLVNLAVSYKLLSYITLEARLENVFDKWYEDILYYGAMGRNFTIGVRFNF